MLLKKGDIVLVPFPFTDLSTTKLRPAVVLWVDQVGNNVTVCFISSQNITELTPEEFAINLADPEFAETGLKVSSKVKVAKVITLERRLINRRLGKLGTNLLEELNGCLKKTFLL